MATKTQNLIPTPEESSSPSQHYIDRLKADLEEAKRCLDEAGAQAARAKAEYLDAEGWRNLLDAYYNRLEKTLAIAADVITLLNNTKNQASTVCSNIKCTVQALQLLTVDVKATSEATESLKQLIKNLLDRVDELNGPVLDPNTSILKCIMELKKAVDEALSANLNAIAAALEVLRLLHVLLCMICETDLDDEPIEDSFIKNLEHLVILIQCGEAPEHGGSGPGGAPEAPLEGGNQQGKRGLTQQPEDEENPCGDEVKDPSCQIDPKPCLCVPRPDNCTSDNCSTEDYHTKTDTDRQNSIELAKYKKCLWENAEEVKSKAQSRYDAIKGALEAAEAAKNC